MGTTDVLRKSIQHTHRHCERLEAARRPGGRGRPAPRRPRADRRLPRPRPASTSTRRRRPRCAKLGGRRTKICHRRPGGPRLPAVELADEIGARWTCSIEDGGLRHGPAGRDVRGVYPRWPTNGGFLSEELARPAHWDALRRRLPRAPGTFIELTPSGRTDQLNAWHSRERSGCVVGRVHAHHRRLGTSSRARIVPERGRRSEKPHASRIGAVTSWPTRASTRSDLRRTP